MSQTVLDSERYGTRHRAAIGISEQTDAVVVVVSEETGSISLVVRGRIERNLTEEQLRRRIFNLIRPQAPRRADPVPAALERGPVAARARTRPRIASRSTPSARVVVTALSRCAGSSRNWQLKLASVAVATILYTGLVFSGTFSDETHPGPRRAGQRLA